MNENFMILLGAVTVSIMVVALCAVLLSALQSDRLGCETRLLTDDSGSAVIEEFCIVE